jgi:VWFA-related protein
MPSSNPPHRSLLFPFTAALLLAAVAAAPAAAPEVADQESTDQQLTDQQLTDQQLTDDVYFDRVDVDIVNLEVFVTDDAGRPVTGLTREDFALLVGGERTEILNFYAAAGPPLPALATLPEETAADAPAPAPLPALPEQSVTLVIVVDERHATAGERKRVLEELADGFAHGLPPATRAMVATLGGGIPGGIEVLQPLTGDSLAIAAALGDLRTSAARGHGESFELRALLRQLEDTSGVRGRSGGAGPSRNEEGTGEVGDILFAIRSYEEKERADLQESLDSLGRLIAGLGGMPGHKAVIYVGRGLNSAPGRALMSAFRAKFGAAIAGSPSEVEIGNAAAATVPAFRRLAELSNANRVSFYAVTTGAVGTSEAISAEIGQVDIGLGRAWGPEVDAVYRADLSAGLEVLADSTGGRALSGSADYELIPDWIAAGAGYFYSLGFAPPTAPTGSSHAIEVDLPGHPDFALRFRRRLITTSREQRAADRTLATLVYGGGDNPLAIAADLGPTQDGDRRTVVQPILVKIPFANLTLLPAGRGYQGELSIHVVAQDAEGRISEVSTLDAPIRLPAERLAAAMAGVAGYRVALGLRPGQQKIAIGVRDVIGNVVSTLVVEHRVAPPAAGRRKARGG